MITEMLKKAKHILIRGSTNFPATSKQALENQVSEYLSWYLRWY